MLIICSSATENEIALYSPEATFDRIFCVAWLYHFRWSNLSVFPSWCSVPAKLYQAPLRRGVAQGYAVSLVQVWRSPLGPCTPYHPSPVQLNQQLQAAGAPGPSPVHSTCNPLEEISAMSFLHIWVPKRSSQPWLSCCPRPAVPSPLKMRCMKFQQLWRNLREQLVTDGTSRHPACWILTQVHASPCSELWGEVPRTSFCLLLMPNLFSVTSAAKSAHHFSEM